MLKNRFLSNYLRIHTRLQNRTTIAKRWLNIDEANGKKILVKYNVRVQKGGVAATADEAASIAAKLYEESQTKLLILKAMVLAGGRGKGHFEDGFKGGIQVLKSPEKVEEISKKMLNKRLITKQTTKEGELVEKLLVLDGLDFTKEFYLAIVLDRQSGGPVLVGSPMGGMDIEEVAKTNPEKIKKIEIDYLKGLKKEQAAEMSDFLGIPHSVKKDAVEQISSLYKLFLGEKALQVEINPLVVAKNDKGHDRVFCVDAKLNFDDSHELKKEEKIADQRMKKAAENNLSFIPLDGNIGCMVNGAGLAMATMDIIKLKGGNPANFLDVGGGASEEQVKTAFDLIASDKNVKGILVNIFGGIMRCDVIANGIINAVKSTKLAVPLIVRLEGTMSDEGRRILSKSGLAIKTATCLDEAAEKAVRFSI